jgi:hypothetical protein
MLPDSEATLHWLDDNMSCNFIPPTAWQVRSQSALPTKLWRVQFIIGCMKKRQRRSIRVSMGNLFMPLWLPFSGLIVDVLVGSERKKFASKAAEALGLGVNELDESLVSFKC